MKNILNKKIIIGLILSLSVFALAFKTSDKQAEARALFSWKTSEVVEGHKELFETMEKLELNKLYQGFSRDLKNDQIEAFLVEAEKNDIEVSLLAGDPTWALDKKGKSMIETIDRVVEINSKLDKASGIKSILFDVEPYTLKEWTGDNKEKIMNNFVRAMKATYKKAQAEDIEVILCIPFYYDNMGFSKQLKELIKSGCDSVAVMNYFKSKEAHNIEREARYAQRYGKKLINIYELQAPGKHGLEEKNTYYNQGIEAVEESFVNIKNELVDKDISIGFHEYRAVKEILDRE